MSLMLNLHLGTPSILIFIKT